MTLKIYTDEMTPRLQYACQIIFEYTLGIPYKLLNVNKEEIDSLEPAIYYTNQNSSFEKTVAIKPDGFIFRQDLVAVDPAFAVRHQLPCLFTNDQAPGIGFDIFSAVFFMASRYEEYLPFDPDQFGRFPEKLSASGKNGFTRLPIVHSWCRLLADQLRRAYPQLTIPVRKPAAIFTYDFDVAYAFRGRYFGTHLLSLLKDIWRRDFKNLSLKWKHRFGLKSDPWDSYSFILDCKVNQIFFFLLTATRTKYDRNINPNHPLIAQLINTCKKKGEIGIHPSYFSSTNTALIAKEKAKLEQWAGMSISKSRQHFLRFTLPGTFHSLQANNLVQEYSMQYAETPGFRAGMCVPFPFYDVVKNEMTDLLIYPGCIMDSTFRDDLHLSAAESWEWYQEMWEQVQAVGGDFICIWHNDLLGNHAQEDHPLHFRKIHCELEKLIVTSLQTQ